MRSTTLHIRGCGVRGVVCGPLPRLSALAGLNLGVCAHGVGDGDGEMAKGERKSLDRREQTMGADSSSGCSCRAQGETLREAPTRDVNSLCRPGLPYASAQLSAFDIDLLVGLCGKI